MSESITTSSSESTPQDLAFACRYLNGRAGTRLTHHDFAL